MQRTGFGAAENNNDVIDKQETPHDFTVQHPPVHVLARQIYGEAFLERLKG
jgi:hypothetical protein